jgi:hypothetical protein
MFDNTYQQITVCVTVYTLDFGDGGSGSVALSSSTSLSLSSALLRRNSSSSNRCSTSVKPCTDEQFGCNVTLLVPCACHRSIALVKDTSLLHAERRKGTQMRARPPNDTKCNGTDCSRQAGVKAACSYELA